MEHLTDKLDLRRLVGILLLELHDKPECAVLKGGICRSYDHSIPGINGKLGPRCRFESIVTNAPGHDIVGYG